MTQGQRARGWLAAGMLLRPTLVSTPSASTLPHGPTTNINSMAGVDPEAPGQEPMTAEEPPQEGRREEAAAGPHVEKSKLQCLERGDGSGSGGRCGAGGDLKDKGAQQQRARSFPSMASEVRIFVNSEKDRKHYYQGAGWQYGTVQYCSILQCSIDAGRTLSRLVVMGCCVL